VRDAELKKLKVLTKDGRHIGRVVDLEFDPESYKIRKLVISLDSDSAKAIGAKRRLIGRSQLLVSVDDISGIGDAVVLRSTVVDLKE